ncbi:MAG: hypothetical protein BA872_03340 [Desulfobacterales bacterium C00003060]|nr:MAG: hypothetical protein BA872_03340 [Desulfobacterales bacterium C00003060]OEU81334.1 MAG: hypothetical protein BA865_03405 [Desulfobacterales bacterium S5133MH4]
MNAKRFFNTAGPVDCERHYCLPPLGRISLEDVLMLIDQHKYFVLHAPRQTGKTTCMLALMDYLNRQGRYNCVYCNVEAAQAAREDVEQGMNDILREIARRARLYLKDSFPQDMLSAYLNPGGYGTALAGLFMDWSLRKDRPLVMIMDEIDSLVGDTLISVLRQLRSGYDQRPSAFPQSIILCGVRDIRDYRIHSDAEKSVITGGNAFNIKAKSLRVGDFIESEVYALLDQHTEETGQAFEPGTRATVWDLTRGQPWLVNALAYEACFESKAGRDRSRTITAPMIQQGAENLIVRRETHLDQLADKLKEERVRRVIGPVLSGQIENRDITDDDIQYLTDLGLIRRKPQVEISNPIYQEVIPRMLTSTTQDMLPFRSPWYVDNTGRLNMDKLLTAFQTFFREHSEHWLERFQYKEAGPQLLMQAFLQRIVNCGGRIEREYGLGRFRTDLLVIWPILQDKGERDISQTGILPDWPLQEVVIELKVRRRESAEAIRTKGLQQTADYMDKCHADEGHLIIFDRRPDVTWEDKIFLEQAEYGGKTIRVWGM